MNFITQNTQNNTSCHSHGAVPVLLNVHWL